MDQIYKGTEEDRGTLTYLEHTMDSLHIIEMEFDGIFTAFYNSCIDG